MLYIFPCSVSLPSQSVQFIFTFFCFQSSIQIIIHTSLRHRNCLLCLTLLFFVDLFTIYLFFPMLSLPLSFLLCSPELPHSITMSPCLLFISQMPLSAQFQLFFLAFLLFCITHQVTHPCLLDSQSPLV